MSQATSEGFARLPAPGDPVLSPFEFWPGWLFYAPVVLQWVWLGIRYGDMSLPTAANPAIETGGLCGESKSAILDQIQGPARDCIARYNTFVVGEEDPLETADSFSWPLVLKPDIGCNGAGVRLIGDSAALMDAVSGYAAGVRLMIQEFVPDPSEAGLFYIRRPNEPSGRITSVTLKHQPSVVGNGRSTLEQLILADPRAGRVPQLYLPRLASRLAEVPPAGTVVKLVFAGNHCKGSVFTDGAGLVTQALTASVDAIAKALPDFHFGRIDVRYVSEAALRQGKGFTLIEINGAGSEATHIWDARCTLRQAYVSQFRHYRAAWEIGHANRARGMRPSGLRAMYRAWRLQRRLMAAYPTND